MVGYSNIVLVISACLSLVQSRSGFMKIDKYILTDSVDVPSVNKASVTAKDSRKEIKCDYPGCGKTLKNTSQRTKHFRRAKRNKAVVWIVMAFSPITAAFLNMLC